MMRPRVRVLGSALAVVALTVFATALLFLYIVGPSGVRRPGLAQLNHDVPTSESDYKTNVWADLTEFEVVDLLDYLHTRSNQLNLTVTAHATSRDNFVHGVGICRPSKQDALQYIDGLAATAPPRWARIVVHHGVSELVTWDEYLVGPLPVSENTVIKPFVYGNATDIYGRPNLVPDAQSFKDWPYAIAESIADITQDLLGGTIDLGNTSDPNRLEISFRDPWIEEGRILRWCTFQRPGVRSDAQTILPQGLYMKLDTTGRESSSWKVLRWYYNGILYNSTEQFRSAWASPGFTKTAINHDGEWTEVQPQQETHKDMDADAPAPIMVQPFGPRYVLEKTNHHLHWMGFDFYWAFAQDTGVTLFDIRFRGERIIYELGLQEAMAQYAGSDPVQGAASYLDSFFGFGRTMFELVPGYDCPAYADFLDSIIYFSETSQRRKNTLCMFESVADYPLQRHTASSYVTVSKNTYLVFRTIAVVGNYDYTVDYLFYLDGSIEVKVRASGYIQAAFFEQEHSRSYGYRIHDHLASSMHDHVINFKLDMDIAGPRNTLLRVDIEPALVAYPWDEESPRRTMAISEHPIPVEQGFDWATNSQSYFLIANAESHNRWGEKRGYKIMPGSGIGTPSHLAFAGSGTLGAAAQWAQRSLWVTKRKENETRSASPRNVFQTQKPLINFDNFLNDENIEQEDM